MVEIEGLDKLLHTHPFFTGLTEPMLETLAGCAANEVHQAGDLLFREGGDADKFYVVRHGIVAVEVTIPGRGVVTLQSLHEGDVLGWSWLVPPYRWTFDARARTAARVISLDAICLRKKLLEDHEMAYHLLTRFVGTMSERLHAARMQMLDLYGPGAGGPGG